MPIILQTYICRKSIRNEERKLWRMNVNSSSNLNLAILSEKKIKVRKMKVNSQYFIVHESYMQGMEAGIQSCLLIRKAVIPLSIKFPIVICIWPRIQDSETNKSSVKTTCKRRRIGFCHRSRWLKKKKEKQKTKNMRIHLKKTHLNDKLKLVVNHEANVQLY